LNRPSETSSRLRAVIASVAGEREKTFAIAVPRPISSVEQAISVSVTTELRP